MISASDALALPNAQLTEDEKQMVAEELVKIEAFIRAKMERRGCDYETTCTNGNVIAEVFAVLKEEGWLPVAMLSREPPRFQGGPSRLVGFKIALAPGDQAVRDHKRPLLS